MSTKQNQTSIEEKAVRAYLKSQAYSKWERRKFLLAIEFLKKTQVYKEWLEAIEEEKKQIYKEMGIE